MKNAVPDIHWNRFREEAYPLGTFMGTPHGNGGGPISTKENRRSCSCVPNLSYISKDIERRRNKEQQARNTRICARKGLFEF